MRITVLMSLTLMTVSLLAACAGPQPTSSRRATYDTASYNSPTPQPAGNAASRQARLTPPTGTPRLDTLPGMYGKDLTTLLGAPQFRRRDGQAEIWQYRGSACTLDIFLYTDGGDLRVRYVEARGRTGAQGAAEVAEARVCASTLVESRAAGAG